jgi:hypothetical protein
MKDISHLVAVPLEPLTPSERAEASEGVRRFRECLRPEISDLDDETFDAVAEIALERFKTWRLGEAVVGIDPARPGVFLIGCPDRWPAQSEITNAARRFFGPAGRISAECLPALIRHGVGCWYRVNVEVDLDES